jgi:hypothetical protein
MRVFGLIKLHYSLFFLVFFVFPGSPFLVSCATAPPLNSERIEQRYGNYGIEVLQSGNNRRLSSLYSVSDAQKTMRTLALVEFTAADDEHLAREHQRILAGESIGAVFKGEGWTIDKISLRYCLSRLDLQSMPELSRMRLGHPATLATRSYVFRVQKDDIKINYATITEIHHPDYLQAADLTPEDLADC